MNCEEGNKGRLVGFVNYHLERKDTAGRADDDFTRFQFGSTHNHQSHQNKSTMFIMSLHHS